MSGRLHKGPSKYVPQGRIRWLSPHLQRFYCKFLVILTLLVTMTPMTSSVLCMWPDTSTSTCWIVCWDCLVFISWLTHPISCLQKVKSNLGRMGRMWVVVINFDTANQIDWFEHYCSNLWTVLTVAGTSLLWNLILAVHDTCCLIHSQPDLRPNYVIPPPYVRRKWKG